MLFEFDNSIDLVLDLLSEGFLRVLELLVEPLIHCFESSPFNLEILKGEKQYSVISASSALKLNLVLLDELLFLLAVDLTFHQGQRLFQQLHLHSLVGCFKLLSELNNLLLAGNELLPEFRILYPQLYYFVAAWRRLANSHY